MAESTGKVWGRRVALWTASVLLLVIVVCGTFRSCRDQLPPGPQPNPWPPGPQPGPWPPGPQPGPVPPDPPRPWVDDFTGTVSRVVSADRFWVRQALWRHIRVQLAFVETPEGPWVVEAQRFTEQLLREGRWKVTGQPVTREPEITVALIKLPDGRYLHYELVRAGWARVTTNGDSQLQQLEQAAKTARLGLWRDVDATHGWWPVRPLSPQAWGDQPTDTMEVL